MIRKIDIKDFFKNPEKLAFKISRDGKYLFYLAPYKNRLNIMRQNIDNGSTKQLTFQEQRDIRAYFEKKEQIFYLQDNNGDENYHLYTVDQETLEYKDLTPYKDVKISIIDSLVELDNDEIIISMNKENKELFDVYSLNINTGSVKLILKNDKNYTSYDTDHNGVIRVANSTDGVNTIYYYRKDESSDFVKFLETSFKDDFSIMQFDSKNKNAYVCSNINIDKSILIEYDFENNTEKTILEIKDCDFSHFSQLYYSYDRNSIVYLIYYTDMQKYHFFDKEYEDLFKRVRIELPNYQIKIISCNKNEDRFIFFASSDIKAGIYYLYDKNTDKLTKLEDIYYWLNSNELARMHTIKYIARDGLEIPAYLTLPKGVDLKNKTNRDPLPLILNPHGGPWYRDFWGFNPEAQFLANRGYAVLRPNFRGSIGFGKSFWEKSFKQWGQSMQDDLTDGVKYLINKGIVDPERIAIYGASYGGYATLMGIIREPDMFFAAIDYVGVSNLFTFMESIPPYWKPYLEMLHEQVGHPEEDKELLKANSPVFHIDKIKTPLFIAQGANDPRVKKAESDQIYEALIKKGVEVKYMVKNDEGHGFANEENRFDFYTKMEEFLFENINKIN